jgi:hypothetical protein
MEEKCSENKNNNNNSGTKQLKKSIGGFSGGMHFRTAGGTGANSSNIF